MNRRALLALAGGWPLAFYPPAVAQQARALRRLAVLMSTVDEANGRERLTALKDALAKLGWSEGQNLHTEIRWGAGNPKLQGQYARQLVQLEPDVIVVGGDAGLKALREQTQTVPIIFIGVADPVARGLVASLAHPTGNITGFANFEFGLDGKWLELLKEIAPQITRVAPIGSPDTVPYEQHLRYVESAAAMIGIAVIAAPVRDTVGIEAAIAGMTGEPPGGLILLNDSFNNRHRSEVLELAARYRVPAIYPAGFIVAQGGLISYGAPLSSQYREAASYVDRILRGAQPADLPVQEPTKFELVINLKTANALKLIVPSSLLARADEVIE